MPELDRFCADFGIDIDRADEALRRERGKDTSALAMTWYVRLIIGIGAWVTAIAAIVLGAVFLELALNVDAAGSLAVLGVIYLGIGLYLLRKMSGGEYLTQLGIAVSAAGVAMIVFGVRFEIQDYRIAALAGALATASIIVDSSPRC
jgi:hypothetical protein